MRLLIALIVQEWRQQIRSWRLRIGLVLFFAAAVPPTLLVLMARRQAIELPAGAVLAAGMVATPFATVLLSVVVAGHTARLEGERELLLCSPLSALGWLGRRAIAQLLVVLPAALIVLVYVLTLASMATNSLPSRTAVNNVAWTGLLVILPRALVATLGWLSLVRVVRSEVAAFFSYFFGLYLLQTTINQVLFSQHIRLESGDWTGFRTMMDWIKLLHSRASRGADELAWVLGSDAPYDLSQILQRELPSLAVPAALALACCAAAVALLGRTTPDAPPVRMRPNHPLRTFVQGLNSIRSHLRPDAGLGARDRIAVLLLMLAALPLALVPVERSRRMLNLLEERYDAEWRNPGLATPRALVVTRWSMSGDVSRSGRIRAASRIELMNRGNSPISHLGLELNRGLELDRIRMIQVAQPPGSPTAIEPSRRRWHRLEFELTEPIQGGATVVLSSLVSGRPLGYSVPLAGLHGETFPDRYNRLRSARFTRELSPLATSVVERKISKRQVVLGGLDLAPVPRFTSWQPVEPISGFGSGRTILSEQRRSTVEVDIDLRLPKGWLLADSCGQVSHQEAGGARLRSSCRIFLQDLMLLGGPLTAAASTDGEAVVATLPEHAKRGRQALEAMLRVVRLSHRAWPGVSGIDRLVAVEIPNPSQATALSLRSARVEAHGQLLRVPEVRLNWQQTSFDARQLVASLILPRLPWREPLEEEELLLRNLLYTVLVKRLGLSEQTAVMTGVPWSKTLLATPLLEATTALPQVWRQRLPAVVHSLEARVGAEALVQTLDAFLRSEDRSPARLRALFDELERRSGKRLDDLWSDYVAGRGLPELRLDKIHVERDRDGARVDGVLINDGSGTARCEIVITAGRQRTAITLEVGSYAVSPFSVGTPFRPHTLQLDPEETCLRFRSLGAKESFNLLGGT